MTNSFQLEPDSQGYLTPPDDCPGFFGVGKSPSRLWVCVQGILRGIPWIATDPSPPSGVFPIDHVAGCIWQSVHDGITFHFFNGLIGPEIDISIAPIVSFFHQAYVPPTSYWFSNSFQNPAIHKFYSGFVIILQNVPNSLRSEQSLCDLADIPKTDEYFSKPRPMANEIAVHSIMSIKHNNFVRIKVDHS